MNGTSSKDDEIASVNLSQPMTGLPSTPSSSQGHCSGLASTPSRALTATEALPRVESTNTLRLLSYSIAV
ncbi:hypothetical protein AN958_08117 [Leucoagaricus sp. SymC.cos]|nr:hypothetical protein AN958_08117 [Leucoagaricus sp. SymC.cos]